MHNRSTTLGQLADLVGGRIQGDPRLPIHGAAVLGEVEAGEITFVDHADRLRRLNSTQAGAVVLSEKVAGFAVTIIRSVAEFTSDETSRVTM